MSHWAQLNEENLVTQILVCDNNDPNGDEGYQWLIDTFGGTWVQTSYNTHGGVHLNDGVPLRKNYAGINYFYDAERDAFIPPKPEGDFLLNETSCLWEEVSQ